MEGRKTSAFEKLLLIVGALILIVGYIMINKVYIVQNGQLTWGFLQTTFLWLLMVIFIILIAIGEDIKESILTRQLAELKNIKELLSKKKR
ncbi:hypothetical protein ISS07_03115 [Candidatus Woesearchaeota archaeon]|nr:hypothetical protein [Candidatus Woesearchaeota archaeon]